MFYSCLYLRQFTEKKKKLIILCSSDACNVWRAPGYFIHQRLHVWKSTSPGYFIYWGSMYGRAPVVLYPPSAPCIDEHLGYFIHQRLRVWRGTCGTLSNKGSMYGGAPGVLYPYSYITYILSYIRTLLVLTNFHQTYNTYW